MVFKTLDIEKDPLAQGFPGHSYDVIIAANVLHATHNLRTTMEHVRSMLRPGGYALLFETTGTYTLRVPFTFGGFPGWWLGEEPGRRLKPIVSAIEWDTILQETGFSGADSVIHDVADESKHTLSLIVSQAVDDDFLRLREPLSAAADIRPLGETLVLIGGKKLLTSKIINEIQKLLPRAWIHQSKIIDSIDSLDSATFYPGMSVICLHEIDAPLFATPMTSQRMAILQGLLMNSRNMLWVSNAGRSLTPHGSMFHGIARVMPTELPQLHLQVLGLDSGQSAAMAAKSCTEAYMRLRQTADADADVESGVLWFHEPEMEVLADGQIMIPRVLPDTAMNEIYTASKHAVTKTVDTADLAVCAVPGPTKMMLQAYDVENAKVDVSTKTRSSAGRRIRVQVKYAFHIPAVDGNGIYLVCGRCSKGSPLMAISSSNASIIDVEPGLLIFVNQDDCTTDILAAMVNRLMVRAISYLAKGKHRVLCYAAVESLVSMISAELDDVYFASPSVDAPDRWIKVHSHASQRSIQKSIPHGVQRYVDCSNLSSKSTASDTLQASLSPSCSRWHLDARLLQEAFQGTEEEVVTLLEDSYSCAKKSPGKAYDYDVMNAAELAGANVLSLAQKKYVTNWQQQNSLLLTISPLDLTGIFRPDRTYLMVGAAGGLGLSICQWMLRNGAKHMVITSRNPKVDPMMFQDILKVGDGKNVHVVPMDVSDKESVERVIQQTQKTMPPIAGVCNAAMVLSDKLFLDMSVDQLNNTLASKVDGTKHLDALFANTPLDFFVLLSSSASVVGNIGQSNYHAANLFMTGLVTQRRSRGLAASIIHVGYVSDVGYVTRNSSRGLDQHFHNMRLTALSETDVHHAFACAIQGGKPGSSSGSHDIIMGLEPPTEPIASDTQTPWLVNPRFAHFVPSRTLQAHQENRASSGNVRQRVDEAQTEDEAIAVVLEAFCSKLESILQLPGGTINENVQRAITDLGIDSLVGVEIRTWFLKDLGVEVPVVKILGGDTVLQVCTAATKKIMAKNISAQEVLPQAALATSLPVLHKFFDRTPESNSASDSQSTDDERGSTIATSEVAHVSDSDALYTKSEVDVGEVEAEIEVEGEGGCIPPEVVHEECMSPAQARIWFLFKHIENPTAYNMVFHYRIQGPLSMTRLRHALHVTTNHHQCLRMCFYPRLGDGHPMQGVMATSAHEFKYVPDAHESDLKQELARLKAHLWDLEAGHTFGVAILSRSAVEHDIVFGYHHIVTDVVGWHIFVQDLDKAYRMQPLDRNAAESHLEYSRRQLEQERSGIFEESLSFWQAEFATLPKPLPLLPMAAVTTRPAEQSDYKSHHEYRELSPTQAAAIKDVSQRLRITPFHFHLTVLQILLASYANAEEICIGVVDANRSDERSSRMLGYLVNMLLVRFHVDSNTTFADVARAASQKALAAFSHATVPFDMILDRIRAPRSSGATPLFQVAVNYRTGGGFWDLPLGNDCRMQLSMEDGKDAETPYDISLGISETAKGCVVEIHCQTSLHTYTASHTILDTYLRLLDGFLSNPHMQVSSCAIHNKAQVSRALELGNGPEIDFRWPLTLSERVSDICDLHSADIAVEDHATSLTYSQLAARISALAAEIRDRGFTANCRIAVLCEPSIDAMVAMLAILHLGAVYVPLDTSLPTARHAAMVHTSKPTLLVFHGATEGRARDLRDQTGDSVQELRIHANALRSHEEVPCLAEPHAPAVLLFTSGSTGTPKGIILSQANFVNHIAMKTHVLKLGQECVLQQSSLGFDMSLVQIFCALANGGRLLIAPQDTRRDPMEVVRLLSRSSVSLTIATPSEYLAWLHYGLSSLRENTAWRHACMGGELVSHHLKTELRRLELRHLRFTNCYGPTEITAAATFQAIQLDENDGDKVQICGWKSAAELFPSDS